MPVVRRELVAETIPSKPWQDVQMDMEDLLAFCLAVQISMTAMHCSSR